MDFSTGLDASLKDSFSVLFNYLSFFLLSLPLPQIGSCNHHSVPQFDRVKATRIKINPKNLIKLKRNTLVRPMEKSVQNSPT